LEGAPTTVSHWDKVHGSTPVERTGWFEAEPDLSLRLVSRCGLGPDDPIVDVGSGASSFVDHLLDAGYRQLIAADISPVALDLLRDRLGERAGSVRFIVDDLALPTDLLDLRDVALWHDRAALHFLTEAADRERYAETVRAVVRPGGFVILAAFALDGAEMCSGLPIHRYDADSLAELLGQDFTLLESVDHTYVNPFGSPRPYVYTRFQRA
jgi:EEF1A lysine methyltransferase 2